MDAERQRVERVQRLFLLHANVLRGFVHGLLPDRHLVEDVLQEIFVSVTAMAGEFREGTNFLAWARTIARLKVYEQVRKRGRAQQILDATAVEALVTAAPEADDAWEVRREALRRCLNELAPRARQMVNLRYAPESPPLEVIAHQMQWTVGAVKVALSRARRFLMACVERRLAAAGEA